MSKLIVSFRSYKSICDKSTSTIARQILLRNFKRNFGCSASLLFHHEPRLNLARLYKKPLPVTVRRYLSTQVIRPYVDPKLSYAFGRSGENLIYSTIAREFDKQVLKSPNETAIVSHSENIEKTFDEFNHDINRLAIALKQKFGITKGDTIGVFAYNCYNWILVEYACAKLGAVLTPINPSYKEHELAFVLKKGKVKCLFMPSSNSIQSKLNDHMRIVQSDKVIELLKDSSERIKLEQIILLDDDHHDDLSKFKLAPYGVRLYNWSSTQDNDGRVFKSEQEAEEANVRLEDACVLSPDLTSPDDLFAVYYTSGTTGQPKGACVSQYTAINNVRLCQIRLRSGRPRNWRVAAATVLPLFHIFAGVLNTLSVAVSDTKVIYASQKYDIKTFVDSIIKHKANMTTLTPTILIDMLTYVEQNNLSHEMPLKIVQPGGAAMAPELVKRAYKLLPQLEDVLTGYGSTENGAVATFQSMYEPESTRAFSVGPPLDFTEVRIVKPSPVDKTNESEACVPLGELGEVQTRGYNTMVEYLDDSAKTKEVITPTNWYRTGDIGFMYPHGSIQITGRLKHMIIKGGENIYPQEVEQMIHKLDAVEKVHVIGVPDERFGEQVCAWIKLKPGYTELHGDYESVKAQHKGNEKALHKEDVLKFCRENITYFKVPKYLLFVEDFPMTPTKKVQSHVMVEETIKILGLKRN